MIARFDTLSLNEKYTIATQKQEDDILWLKLTPKSIESNFKYILVGLKSDMLYGMGLRNVHKIT